MTKGNWIEGKDKELYPDHVSIMSGAIVEISAEKDYQDTLKTLRIKNQEFLGYAIMVNDKDSIGCLYDPNFHEEIEDLKRYTDHADTVKVMVICDPGIPKKHLINTLQGFANYLNENTPYALSLSKEQMLRAVDVRKDAKQQGPPE